MPAGIAEEPGGKGGVRHHGRFGFRYDGIGGGERLGGEACERVGPFCFVSREERLRIGLTTRNGNERGERNEQ